ncbi:MAG TPA: nicotinamide riboside transporter PnuC [Nevskiaceae bacterium]|nr:nicotinamide riboside transporter PnuC [Nevskiaceae bacterium]
MTAVEAIAALVSAAAVWLTVQRQMLSYPVGIASVVLYAWVFVVARLYSDALLQGFFGVMLVYGWFHWQRHLTDDGLVQPAPLAWRPACGGVVISLIGAVALGYLMHRYTNAALPWLDSLLTALSLLAQWWQSRRHIAAWWLWIGVDVVYVGEYIYKDLRITSVLYAGFVVLAILGLRAWQRATAPETPATPDSR